MKVKKTSNIRGKLFGRDEKPQGVAKIKNRTCGLRVCVCIYILIFLLKTV